MDTIVDDDNLKVKTKAYESEAGAYVFIQWICPQGFGEVWIDMDDENKARINSEYMGKDFVKMLLCKMVDNAELLD